MNYQSAKELFDKAKNKSNGKPIANNTRLVQSGNDYAVRLHQTNVVTFKQNGAIILNTGGWKTVTTKERLNGYAPVRIYSDRGTWYVSKGAERFIFQDGFTINPDGSYSGYAPASQTDKEKELRKKVSAYAKGFIDALYAGEVKAPSNGDCWHCLMREQSTGKPLGEVTKDRSHLESHMEENYFVPSLLVNAMNMFGASIAAKQTAYAYMQGQAEQHAFSRNRNDFIAKQLEKNVRRYVLRQLGCAV